MAHLIDKDALVAEINKRIINAPINYIGHQRVWAYNNVKDIINTLEVKEVDLEKEIDEWCDKCKSDYELEGWVGIAIQNVAKHFFELGLKARQG